MIIALVEPGTNLGFSVGVNRGLSAVRERWGAARVLLINSDATLLTGALAALHGSLDQGAYLAAPLLLSPDGHVKRLMYYHRWTGLLFSHEVPGAFPHLSGCCLLLSQSAARQDLLDERFFFYGEDAFLGWTLVRSGKAAVVVESARVLHQGSGSSRRGSLFYEYHMARAHMELATAMSSNRLEAVGLLLGRCLSLPARALWRAFRQRSMAPIRGLAMAVHDFRRGQISKLTPKAG
jgi:GT2 family glycosyltransferase